jgi:putative ABC transport system permease protein
MLLQDVRYALRSLARSRTFTVVAVSCLAFGLGLNTTIFSVVDGVLLKPLPYADPERLVVVQGTNAKLDVSRADVSYLDIQDLRSGGSALSGVAALQYRSLTLSDTGADPERYQGAVVSWDLFPLLGIAPVVGQGFTPAMDQPGAARVLLLSYVVWRDRYQLDAGIVGRRVLVNGEPAEVVGVMPEHVEFPERQKLWMPLAPVAAKANRDQRDLTTFARLAPGATIAGAIAELGARGASLQRQYPDTNENWGLTVRPLREEFVPDDVTQVIWIMMAAVTLVLFIACSNVANLQVARAASRLRELAVRSSLGAGRGRIIRQLLTESVVLSLMSLPLAMLVAAAGSRLIAGAMPADQVPYYITWTLDWRSMAYAFAVAVATAVTFGLLPALQASRSNLVNALKDGGRGSSGRRSRLRNVLVVVQVSLALVALVGALLFVRTFANLDSYDVGFNTTRMLTQRFYMPGAGYDEADARARRVEDIVRRVEALPGVEAAFASNLIPVSGGGGGGGAVIDGRPSEPGHEPFISFVGVTPHFHRTLGVKMRDGRDFTDAEGWSSQPLAIVNETMAARFWAGGRAVGGRFRLAGAQSGPWFTVIGVAPDIQHDDIDPEDEPFPAAYVPYHFQQTASTGLVIRTVGDPLAMAAAAREAVRASDSNVPVTFVRTMEDVRRLGFWEFALFGWIFGVTGVVGLLLALVGVYGVLSFAVSQRAAEIGVRMALGADRRAVIRLIVGHGLALAGTGVVVGLVLAPAGTWFARSFFYNVSPFDPLTFAAVAIFLLAVAALASYLPARRATRVDPVTVLRE